MKARGPVRCEKCKITIHTGSPVVRFHGRLWHPACVADWLRSRQLDREKVPA
jgi:hypothetical protein